MTRRFVLALLVLGFASSFASAVQLDNIRPCWGLPPVGMFGATRYDAKCLPGDVLYMTYDINDLAVDPKTKQVRYDTTLELLDAKGAVIFKNVSPNAASPALGGKRMPGDLHIIMAPKQAPGNYSIRLTINDKVADKSIAFKYDFEVIPDGFGFRECFLPSIGFPGQHHAPVFSLVNLTLAKTDVLDDKGKAVLDKQGNKVQVLAPNAELTIRILDENKKEVVETAKMEFPKDLPKGTDLNKLNVVQLTHPIYLNRAGRFTVEIVATDKNAKNAKDARRELVYPLSVLDVKRIEDNK